MNMPGKVSGRTFVARKAAGSITAVVMVGIALLFVGGFWLLNDSGIVGTGTTTAVVGIVLYFLVAVPVALVAGFTSEQKLDADDA